MGSESLLIHCAEGILEQGHEICGVVSSDRQIRAWATERNLPLFAPRRAELADALRATTFDYFFSIANLAIVPDEVLAMPSQFAVNFHDGPLPRYSGMYATAWALINGETEHGITFHVMTDQVDEGDILKQKLFPVSDGETSFTLNTKCYENAIEVFAELVGELGSGTVKRRPQDLEQRTYFGRFKRPEAAGVIDWSRSAADIAALVRALEFGPIENPLSLGKLIVGDDIIALTAVDVVDGETDAAPGTITRVDGDIVGVATGSGEIVLRGLRTLDGAELSIADLVARHGIEQGVSLTRLDKGTAQALSEANATICKHEKFWVRRLGRLEPIDIPFADRTASSASDGFSSRIMPIESIEAGGESGARADAAVAAVAVYLARIADKSRFAVGFRDTALDSAISGLDRFFATHVPLEFEFDLAENFARAGETVSAELANVRKRMTYARDAIARYPGLRQPELPVVVAQVESLDGYQPPAGAELAVAIAADGSECRWFYKDSVYSERSIASMQAQLATLVEGARRDASQNLAALPLLAEADLKTILIDWNATETPYPTDACIHQLFEDQAERRPGAPALSYLDNELSYRELNSRANQLAHYLVELGVGPDVLVGVCIERSIDMMVAILGILKAGGAYVPMDPSYPTERLALMLEDSQVKVLLTQQSLRSSLPETTASMVYIDMEWDDIAERSTDNPDGDVEPSNLAYTIYTSGSTGKPKGVMVEHRNVVNFFVGMDERLGHSPDRDEPGVWLAVTSLSFDISVLELFWTLARGFKVVLHSDSADDAAIAKRRFRHADKQVTFSLMYFASDEGASETSADKYKLLIEGAKFGDKNGFSAVWTPERHFHAFGGLYPNPSVASAAIAMITDRIRIRAGSCVLPLHPPIRVAEEWALVDNLSNGRVDISFAAGWQPNDFVLRPGNFPDRKNIMLRDIEVVRALWRGESITLESPTGKEIQVRTLPRPIQPELPYWLTAAGNPATFEAAGKSGANILTHLLGQTIEEVTEKIAVYRKARQDAGHPGRGEATLMLHTFIGPDEDEVRETVRQPMKDYLRSALNLVKAASWTFPTFQKEADATGKTPQQIFEERDLSDEEMEALLDHSFTRYYKTSGLFGTPDSCLDIIDRVKGCDVDDVACLLDYGVPSEMVLSHLKYLNMVRERSNQTVSAGADYSLPAQIRRHGVTHFQCTPSQMSMILADEEAKKALGTVRTIMIGGEAFPPVLAKQLGAIATGNIINMYGPTETTIWSSTQPVKGDEDRVDIGRPIANTSIYILDRARHPVPVGIPGELYIGGAGVVRGYYERPELTAERFVDNPFVSGQRIYRTGDLARYAEDGTIEFLGRVDFQVKIRGYRIELGEIESQLHACDPVREVVVIAREDVPGDKRLVAYMIAKDGQTISIGDIRSRLRDALPAYMVPSNFVVLDAFPLTPNGKIDRKSLVAPEQVEVAPETVYVAPEGALEQNIATVWTEVLNVKKVGMDDNFFDLGGHSLLMVQAHRRMQELTSVQLSLTDLFRFPTIRTLVGFLSDEGDSAEATRAKSQERAETRKASMARRKRMRQRRRPEK